MYLAGRTAGVELLGLRAGDTVLDLGCGTGLSFELLVRAVGPAGHVIGVDASKQMLRVASRRAKRNGWENVHLVLADATAGYTLPRQVDAVFSAYALSVMKDADSALERAATFLAPGGRVGIVDMQRPTGAARIFTPLARMACAFGGSDIDAHPWEWLEKRGLDVRRASRCGGHIRIVSGAL